MAIINNLLDSPRGKLGTAVFYKVGDQGRVRTKPARYNDKKSPAQLAQRQRLQLVTGFLKPFSSLIRITFAAEAVGRSAMQAAQSFNMRNATAGEYPDVYIDKSRALLSRGLLPVPLSATVTAQSDGLLIEWENSPEAVVRNGSDTLLVMCWSAKTGSIDFRFTEARRTDGRYLWRPALSDEPVAAWIAFRNQSQTGMSDSMYVGDENC